jgi:hypothetical protein
MKAGSDCNQGAAGSAPSSAVARALFLGGVACQWTSTSTLSNNREPVQWEKFEASDHPLNLSADDKGDANCNK